METSVNRFCIQIHLILWSLQSWQLWTRIWIAYVSIVKLQRLKEIPFVVWKVTNGTIVVQQKAIICEIRHVNVKRIMKNTESEKETAVFDKVNINMDKLSEFKIQQGKNLLHRYFNILSRTTWTWDFHPSNSHNARYHQICIRKEEVTYSKCLMLESFADPIRPLICINHSTCQTKNSLRICTDYQIIT